MESDHAEATNKGKTISVRVSMSDWGHIAIAADNANLSLSDYVRRCVLSKKMPATQHLDVLKELRRIAMRLKQLASSTDADRAQLDHTLKALRVIFEGLSK